MIYVIDELIKFAIYSEHHQSRLSAEIQYTIPVMAKITGEIQLDPGNRVPRLATYNGGNRNRL